MLWESPKRVRRALGQWYAPMIDTHCHILPGLDDGACDLDEALAMCEVARDDGIEAVVATPHMLDGVYDVGRADVLGEVDRLNAAAKAAGCDLRVLPGSEVHIHEGLLDDVEATGALTLGDSGRYLLLEFPHNRIIPNTEQIIFSLQLQRFTPILAHIERNADVQEDPECLVPFVQAGAVVQITGHSLLGRFGSVAQQCAEALVEHALAHIVASDSHGPTDRQPVLSGAVARIEELAGPETAALMCDTRPRRVIEGKPFSLPEPLPFKSRRRSWFSFLFR